MMIAYQIRVYEFPEGASSASIERSVVALLTLPQRIVLQHWLKQQFGERAIIVRYDLHNFATVKEALLVPRTNLVAGAIWPNAPQGTIPIPGLNKRKRKAKR